ncbi:methyltransferase domain-containing protein [Mycolicibacterium sp. XJ662]
MTQQVDYRALRRTEAENYQRHFAPLIPGPLAADLVEIAAPESGEYVVDVACGTGVLTRLVAERVGAGGRVVGVDLTPEMLQVARETPAPPGATIDWREASAEALPLADESYDLVLCQLGVMFFPNRTAAVREMHRVLSPGGRIAINVPATMPAVFEIMVEALGRHVDPGLPGFLRTIFSVSETELHKLVNDSGFRDVSITTATRTFCLSKPKDFLWQYISATPTSGLVAAADDDRRQHFEDDILARWQRFVDHERLVTELAVATAAARK